MDLLWEWHGWSVLAHAIRSARVLQQFLFLIFSVLFFSLFAFAFILGANISQSDRQVATPDARSTSFSLKHDVVFVCYGFPRVSHGAPARWLWTQSFINVFSNYHVFLCACVCVYRCFVALVCGWSSARAPLCLSPPVYLMQSCPKRPLCALNSKNSNRKWIEIKTNKI